VELSVFGPIEARGPSGPIELTRAKERTLLAALALFHGRVVSTDRLADALWADFPPERPEKVLQVHVRRVRAALGAGVVETHSDGYALAPSVVVDAKLFETEVNEGDSPQPLRVALARWKGEPYVDLGEWAPAELERTRLAELRDHALETCLALEIETGPAAGCIAELEAMVEDNPLRERRWFLLMTALSRNGRTADALRTYQRARKVFGEELGIDPGPELRVLEEQILMAGVESDTAVGSAPPAATLPSGVVTFLLTDIEGSTELWERDAAGMSRALRLHDALIEAAVRKAAGKVLKARGEGDSTFSVFGRPTEAVSAALAARRALDAQDWPDGLRLEVRFAVHMGEVEERDREYYGTAVNRAVRIRSLAIGGQILVSHAVAEVVRDHLADDVSLVELGEHHLRGLAHPERVCAVVDAARPVREAIGGVCPYKGLLAFEPEDSDVFFGREETVGLLLGRLLARRFVVVVGASGSGKSSVVRAGVAATIRRGEVPGSDSWRSIILTPGEHPLAVLPAEVDHADATDRVVLVVDQMEELFTACRDPSEREQFVDGLLDAVEHGDGGVLVACALRADFFGHCAAIPRLASALSDASVLLGVMTGRELQRAIEGPAEVAGLRLETGLVDVMLRDLAHEPGSLPLLSHALLETWRRRSGRTLTLHGYKESGGVRGAIAKTAEAVWADALTERRRPVARRIFLRLTELGEGTEDTRRRVTRAELVSGIDAEATDEVLGLLVDRRLVTADDTTVQVAHEALIREWPRLRAWLDEDREGLRAHRHLTHAAEDWAALGRAPSELYRGPRLAATREWLGRDDAVQLNELEAAFLDASEAREQAERRAQERGTRRLRTLFAAAVLLLVVALVGGLVAITQRNRAKRQATVADSQRLAIQARALVDGHLDLALLLAVEARKLDDSVAARGALEAVLSRGSRLERFVPLGASTASTLSPDGRRLAISHPDGTVTVRDLTSGRVLTRFAASATGAHMLAFSADGRTLAVSQDDGTVELRDLNTGTSGVPLSGRAGGYFPLAFSPDGRQLAGADSQGEVVMWALTSPVRAATALGRSSTVTALAWSSDSQTLATLDPDPNGGVTVWDASTGQPTRQIPVPNASAQALAFGPDRRTLAVGGQDGHIMLFDVGTGRQAGPPLGESGPGVNWLAFGPDAATLNAGNEAGTVTQWDVVTRRQRGSPVGVGGDAFRGAVTGDGRLVTLGLRTAAVWRLGSVGPALGRLVARFSGGAAGVFLSRDGSLAWMSAISGDHWVLFDMRRGQVRATHPDTGTTYFVAWSPDATTVAIGLADGRVRLVDPTTGQTRGMFVGHHGPVNVTAFSPDGRSVAAGTNDGTVLVWDLATHRPLGAPYQRQGAVYGVAYSPDGKRLAVAGVGGTLVVYDLGTHRPLHTYHFGIQALIRAAFSPDGKTLAVAASQGTILIDGATGRPLGEPLAGHRFQVFDLDFSGNGTTLATSSLDGTVILYDVASRQPIGDPLDAGYGVPYASTLTPDGHTLATSYDQGQVVIWDIDPDSWQRRACAAAGRNLTGDEWRQYLGARPYHATCPQWPGP
jgi:WD40 repeat protein/class 3 adenylate cyclase